MRVKNYRYFERFLLNCFWKDLLLRVCCKSFERLVFEQIFQKFLEVRIKSFDGFIFTNVLQAFALPLVRLVQGLQFWVKIKTVDYTYDLLSFHYNRAFSLIFQAYASIWSKRLREFMESMGFKRAILCTKFPKRTSNLRILEKMNCFTT